jgi:hypothetical protein
MLGSILKFLCQACSPNDNFRSLPEAHSSSSLFKLDLLLVNRMSDCMVIGNRSRRRSGKIIKSRRFLRWRKKIA